MTMFGSSIALVVGCVLALGIGTAFFARTIRQVDGLTPEKKIAAWEVFMKAITTSAAVIAGLFAFVQYIDQRERELVVSEYAAAQKVREFNISMYGEATSYDQAKRVFLNEAADLVATIATLDDLHGPTGTIAIDRFERLYHGQLVLYEGKDVESAMVLFRGALDNWRKPNAQKPPNMRSLALDLSRACKKELKELPETVDIAK